MSSEQHLPVVNQYVEGKTQGWESGRTIKEIEGAWRLETEFSIPSIDDLLTEQLEQAILSGRAEVALLDIGSGVGKLLQGIRERSNQLPKTMAFLEKNPDFQLKCIGFTDAKTPESFMTKRELPAKDPHPQISADNYFYTLTSRQTVTDFLRQIGQSEVQLVLGTLSLAYVGATTFGHAIEDSFAALSPAGKMLLSGYGTKHPGFETVFFVRQLNQKGLIDSDQEWQQQLEHLISGDFVTDGLDMNTFLQKMEPLLDRFTHIPEFAEEFAIAREQIATQKKLLTNWLHKVFTPKEEKERELFQLKNIFARAVMRASQKLGERKVMALWLEKIRVFGEFVKRHESEIAHLNRSDMTILLQKASASPIKSA